MSNFFTNLFRPSQPRPSQPQLPSSTTYPINATNIDVALENLGNAIKGNREKINNLVQNIGNTIDQINNEIVAIKSYIISIINKPRSTPAEKKMANVTEEQLYGYVEKINKLIQDINNYDNPNIAKLTNISNSLTNILTKLQKLKSDGTQGKFIPPPSPPPNPAGKLSEEEEEEGEEEEEEEGEEEGEEENMPPLEPADQQRQLMDELREKTRNRNTGIDINELDGGKRKRKTHKRKSHHRNIKHKKTMKKSMKGGFIAKFSNKSRRTRSIRRRGSKSRK